MENKKNKISSVKFALFLTTLIYSIFFLLIFFCRSKTKFQNKITSSYRTINIQLIKNESLQQIQQLNNSTANNTPQNHSLYSNTDIEQINNRDILNAQQSKTIDVEQSDLQYNHVEKDNIFDKSTNEKNNLQIYNYYLAIIDKKIKEELVYPIQARRKGTEGVVKILITVSPVGSLLKATIIESSNSVLLDKSALTLIKKIFPINIENKKYLLQNNLSTEISIVYKLNKKD